MSVLSGNGKRGRLARLLPFMGPAFVASVAYMDPGNFATNIQGGAQFGYTLLWVIIASNLMAMLIQTLSAKLGIATGLNLAEHCRTRFAKPLVVLMWVVMEIVAMATDLAEFLGAAVGFYLLFGVPLLPAGIITAVVTFLVLGLERYGFRPLEAVITALVGVIAVSYLFETILVKPRWGEVLYHAVVPRFSGSESVLLATGILGATVMPHAIYLHSALTQGRIVVKEAEQQRRLFRYELVDVLVAMGLASMVNAAMLIMAASTFFRHGHTEVGTLEQAHLTLEPLLGPLDGNPEHEQGLAAARGIAAVYQAGLNLVMVVHNVETLPAEDAAAARMLPRVTAALLDIAQKNAEDYLGAHVARLRTEGFPAEMAVLRGDPVTAISKTAERTGADLVVLATHAKTGLDAFWSRSATPRISGKLRIPILLVPVVGKGAGLHAAGCGVDDDV